MSMKTACKAMGLVVLAAGTGAAVCCRWKIRMPLSEFTRYALYMAVLDEEICRNELEGSRIDGRTIEFPPRMETLQERYHWFLRLNQKKNRRELREEIAAMEHRLRISRQYTGQVDMQR